MRRISKSTGLIITSERAFSVPTATAQGKSSNIVSSLGLRVIGEIVSGKILPPQRW